MALKRTAAVTLTVATRHATSDLVLAQEQLVEAAGAAQRKAYAPYSGFAVGAAVRASSGKIYVGVNVENRSYGLTVCAERNALSSAVVAGEREFSAIAIATDANPPAPPCGACREVLAEFNPDLPIILRGGKGQLKLTTLAKLLPDPFVFRPKVFKAKVFKPSLSKKKNARHSLARKPIAE